VSGTEWVLFAAIGFGCLVFLACVVWSIGKAAGWMRRDDDD
jgi:hypothetical protein